MLTCKAHAQAKEIVARVEKDSPNIKFRQINPTIMMHMHINYGPTQAFDTRIRFLDSAVGRISPKKIDTLILTKYSEESC